MTDRRVLAQSVDLRRDKLGVSTTCHRSSFDLIPLSSIRYRHITHPYPLPNLHFYHRLEKQTNKMIGPILLGVVAAAGPGSALIIRPSPDPIQSILITSQPPVLGLDTCLQSTYYGAYGGSSAQREYIYLPTSDCLGNEHALNALDVGSLTFLDEADLGDGGRIVWVGQAGVSPEILSVEGGSMMDWWTTIQTRALSPASTTLIKRQNDPSQSHYTASSPKTLKMLHASAHSLLLSVPEEYVPILDTLLPRHLVPVALPQQAYSSSGENAWEPVPEHLAKHLANITANLTFDSALDKILNEGLQVDQLRRDIRWLTGEGPSGIESRHSFTEGAIKAAHYIKGMSYILFELFEKHSADDGRDWRRIWGELRAIPLLTRIRT